MKKLVCLDMDGTVYLGDKLFDCAPAVFDFFKKNNIRFMFLTNNSSHSKKDYVKKMRKLGIECDESNFYTSIDVTINYLKYKGIDDVFVLGVKSFKDEIKKEFHVIEKYEKGTKCNAVIASFDTELVYSELKDACLYIQDGAKFLATNCDLRCPIEDGYYIPDCGGLCKWIEMCTNVEPRFLGKPEPIMLFQVMEHNGFSKEETIMVGDRGYTDIMAGINAGVDTLAVLSGECTKEDFLKLEKQPTYIEDSIASLIDICIK